MAFPYVLPFTFGAVNVEPGVLLAGGVVHAPEVANVVLAPNVATSGAFFQADVGHGLAPEYLAPTLAFHATLLGLAIAPGLPSGATVHTPDAGLQVAPSLVASTAAVHAPSVAAPVAQTLTPGLVPSALTVHAPTVYLGGADVFLTAGDVGPTVVVHSPVLGFVAPFADMCASLAFVLPGASLSDVTLESSATRAVLEG